MTKVLFLCLGNICRSPTAEAVFRAQVKRLNLSQQFHIESAGTSNWHIGEPADKRSQAAALKRGIDMSALRGQQLVVEDFNRFDYIWAMDANNLRAALELQPENSRATVELFMRYAPSFPQQVPDPYYGGEGGFESVLDMLEAAAQGYLAQHQ